MMLNNKLLNLKLNKLLVNLIKNEYNLLPKNFSSLNENYLVSVENENKKIKINKDLVYDTAFDIKLDPFSSVIEKDFIKTLKPTLKPTFNLAKYADRLDIIRHFVQLNVKLCEIEKNRDLTKLLLKLDFEKDVKPYLNFLIQIGLQKKDLGDFLTKNFEIFNENIINLNKRINFLRKMNFSNKQIIKMLLEFPNLLNIPIIKIDEKLGYIQHFLKIKPFFVNKMLINCPKILLVPTVTLSVKKILLMDRCGFDEKQMKNILIKNSKILIKRDEESYVIFDYIYRNITKDLELISNFPTVLNLSLITFEERHEFLKKLKRNQYNIKEPLYVPLSAFEIDEENFLKEYCKATKEDYYKFLKTL